MKPQIHITAHPTAINLVRAVMRDAGWPPVILVLDPDCPLASVYTVPA